MELGFWVGAANPLGEPIPIGRAGEALVGVCLLNDWSARDVQGWEYQPLGPFLAKSFHTSISPWIVLAEALAPFRLAQPPRPEGDPAPLPYLLDADDQARGALDITVEVLIETPAMRAAKLAPHRLSVGTSRDMYWTPAQLVAHQTSAGCDLHPGDLLGSGTISGTQPGSYGSLLELTEGGRKAITLPSGETRRFLEDGDEIIMRGRCAREGAVSIGLGECRGRILPAPPIAA
jgi:fumarylacetoacetase